jgi:hypothetical protein
MQIDFIHGEKGTNRVSQEAGEAQEPGVWSFHSFIYSFICIP